MDSEFETWLTAFQNWLEATGELKAEVKSQRELGITPEEVARLCTELAEE